ncbi:MAG: hypothetical protein FJ247_06255 [Nitrospira sp.]|nr:hypothetical protein [Nitrospira sp.]
MILLNLFLCVIVTTVGFWILWGADWPLVVAGWALAAGGFLWWRARSVAELWAWATLGLGLESFLWPILVMSQLKHASETPSDEELGTILSAVVMGLFSSVFWISFSYGLFKRAWKSTADSAGHTASDGKPSRPAKRNKGH